MSVTDDDRKHLREEEEKLRADARRDAEQLGDGLLQYELGGRVPDLRSGGRRRRSRGRARVVVACVAVVGGALALIAGLRSRPSEAPRATSEPPAAVRVVSDTAGARASRGGNGHRPVPSSRRDAMTRGDHVSAARPSRSFELGRAEVTAHDPSALTKSMRDTRERTAEVLSTSRLRLPGTEPGSRERFLDDLVRVTTTPRLAARDERRAGSTAPTAAGDGGSVHRGAGQVEQPAPVPIPQTRLPAQAPRDPDGRPASRSEATGPNGPRPWWRTSRTGELRPWWRAAPDQPPSAMPRARWRSGSVVPPVAPAPHADPFDEAP